MFGWVQQIGDLYRQWPILIEQINRLEKKVVALMASVADLGLKLDGAIALLDQVATVIPAEVSEIKVKLEELIAGLKAEYEIPDDLLAKADAISASLTGLGAAIAGISDGVFPAPPAPPVEEPAPVEPPTEPPVEEAPVE